MTTTYQKACLELAHYFEQYPNTPESDPEVIRLRRIIDSIPHDYHVKHNHRKCHKDLDRNISELFWQGYTIGNIAKQVGYSIETVRKHMRKLGLNPKDNQKNHISVQKIRKQLTKGMTIEEMASDHVPQKTIRKIILENGMMTRYKELQHTKHQLVFKTDKGYIAYENRDELLREEHIGMKKFEQYRKTKLIITRFEYLKKVGTRVF